MRFITFEDFKASLLSLKKLLSLKADKSEVEKKANKSDVKHANLAQNNTREPDYVENRTHWIEEVETVIAEKQNVTTSADGSVFTGVINSLSGLNVGSNYIVEFNEKTYDCAGFVAAMQTNAEQEYSLKVTKNSLGTGILEFARDDSKMLHEGDILLISGLCYYVNNEPEMTDTKMYVSVYGNPYVRTTDTLYKVKDGTAFIGVTAIGSVNVLSSKEAEFPFLIFDTGYETRLVTKETGTYSVGYTRKTEKVHTIDTKYLPDDTHNSNPDWKQVSSNCASYIENKPFGDTTSRITITALNYGSGQLSEEISESATYSLIFRGELFSDCHFTNRNGDLGLYLEKYKLTLITVNGDKSKIRIRTARFDIEDLCISDIEIYKITGQKKIDAKYLPEGGGGGSANAVQFVAQTLTDEQKKQARKNIGASPIPTVRYWLKLEADNIINLYNMGVGYGIISPVDIDQTVPIGMSSPMLVIFGRMSYSIVDITVYDGAGAVWRGSLNLSSQTTDVTKTGDYVTNTALTDILQNYVPADNYEENLQEIAQLFATKLDKNQGAGNAGKILGIGADGNVVPQDKPTYTLPQATADALGGIKADAATAEDTQVVRIGTDGKLRTKPTGGSTVTVDDALSSNSVNPVQNKIVTAALAEKITAPTTAAVGQIIKVKSVDTAGKPTEWEAADLPSGGGETWTLIKDITLAEDVASIEEQNLNLKKLYLTMAIVGTSQNTSSVNGKLLINDEVYFYSNLIGAMEGIKRWLASYVELIGDVKMHITSANNNNTYESNKINIGYFGDGTVINALKIMPFSVPGKYIGAGTRVKIYGISA